MPDQERRKNKDLSYFRIVVQGIISILVMMALIFVLAGRMNYWQGWAFLVFTGIGVSIQIIAFAGKTEVLKERFNPGPGTKWWDKIFWALYLPLFLTVMIVACLDTGRFRWTANLPAYIYIIGYLGFALSIFLYSWAMWVNRFFSTMVRIQTDRGQTVVQDGPYRFVRHPGYVAGIVMAASLALIFGSLWALLPAAGVMLLLIIRTHLEDSVLKIELPGYADYAQKVRCRLLPGVW